MARIKGSYESSLRLFLSLSVPRTDNVISFAYGELKIAFSTEANLPSDCMQRAAALAKSQSFQKITALVHMS